ncbi:MAG: sulfotransferase domain-containing protein [Bacillota bacterium]
MLKLNQRFPYYLKKILNKVHYHRQSQKNDIFIFSTFRSGSTWLAETIKSHPGIKFPIAPDKIEFLENIDPYFKEIKARPYYIDLSPDEKERLKKYVKLASAGEIVFGRRYVDLFARHHSFLTDRSVFRLLRSNFMVQWYLENFDLDMIFLFRHPIAASLSRHRAWKESTNPDFWSPKTDYLLHSEYFKNNYLTPEIKEFITAINKYGSMNEQFVLSWCLENLPLIEQIKNNQSEFIHLLTYEDLLINPDQVITYLSQQLDLIHKDKLLQSLEIPSSTTRYSDKKTRKKFDEHQYNQEYLLKKWRKKISAEETEKLMSIVEFFDINIYNSKSFMPQDKYLIKLSD